MKKFWIQLFTLIIIIIGSIYVVFNQSSVNFTLPGSTVVYAQKKIKVGEITTNIEVADTADKRARGLGGRESLTSDSGMLFTFPAEMKYRFWMKGMNFPLDIIFIRQGKVVDFLQNIPPPMPGQKDESLPIFEPTQVVNMVLEVNTGYISSHNIKIGDNVSIIE